VARPEAGGEAFGDHRGTDRWATVLSCVWQIVIAGAMVISRVADAAPVRLSCYGEMHILRARSEQVNKQSLLVTIDVRAETVTVGSYEPVPMVGKPDRDTVMFTAKPGSSVGVSAGTLNRMTGETSINIITLTDGVYKFEGVCKPAERLF
jgi:hypothetical protein